MPKISVIIPVFNAEKYINQCILSIANQTMKDIEIIAINDGSTDKSLNILDQLSSKYKGKIKIIDKSNSGAGAARNIGIENSNGEFIKFVDADDYLNVNILEKMYTIAKEYKVSLVRDNYQIIVGPFKMEDKCSWNDIHSNQVINLSQNKDYIVTEMPGIGNKLISRNLIGDLRFPEKTKWEDLAIIPVVIASSEKLFHLNEPVYNYRINMNTTIKDFINSIPNILDIIKCAENLENEMKIRGYSDQYKDQIESLYILHTLFRIENAMLWINFPHNKKEIIISSLLSILSAKYPDWQNNKLVQQYKQKNVLFNFDVNRIFKFIDHDYTNVDRITAENNIKNSFKMH